MILYNIHVSIAHCSLSNHSIPMIYQYHCYMVYVATLLWYSTIPMWVTILYQCHCYLVWWYDTLPLIIHKTNPSLRLCWPIQGWCWWYLSFKHSDRVILTWVWNSNAGPVIIFPFENRSESFCSKILIFGILVQEYKHTVKNFALPGQLRLNRKSGKIMCSAAVKMALFPQNIMCFSTFLALTTNDHVACR